MSKALDNQKTIKKHPLNADSEMPDTFIDKDSGKTFEKGEDYSSDAYLDELCTHENLKKLGFSYYACNDCGVIFQIPFTIQTTYEQMLEHFHSVTLSAQKYFKKFKKKVENAKDTQSDTKKT